MGCEHGVQAEPASSVESATQIIVSLALLVMIKPGGHVLFASKIKLPDWPQISASNVATTPPNIQANLLAGRTHSTQKSKESEVRSPPVLKGSDTNLQSAWLLSHCAVRRRSQMLSISN